jgi:ATP adenylyltransferase
MISAPTNGGTDDAQANLADTLGLFEATEPGNAYGVPDGFQRLWTPHRMAYVSGEARPATRERADCPFCLAPAQDDKKTLIVRRGVTCFVLLNLYPYSSGHLLVCPYRHVSNYIDLTTEETAEFAALTQQAIRTLKAVSNPQGFNIGMNQERAGGAGIAAHLHQHIVPRWIGDSNFLPIIAQTRAIGQLLSEVQQQLADMWIA